jgi:S-adenosylmethionine decarboxylase
MDYKVRGFTRTVEGDKLYIDHDINSVQNYIDEAILRKYNAIDINVYQANIFHTKMLIKEIDLSNYLFDTDVKGLSPEEVIQITESLRREMVEIYSGKNVYATAAGRKTLR